jgi:hypothetical protein
LVVNFFTLCNFSQLKYNCCEKICQLDLVIIFSRIFAAHLARLARFDKLTQGHEDSLSERWSGHRVGDLPGASRGWAKGMAARDRSAQPVIELFASRGWTKGMAARDRSSQVK